MKKIIVVFLLLSVFAAKTQNHKEVKWSFTKKKLGKETILSLTATIDNGWHLYSQNMNGDGPIPTSFDYKLPHGLKLLGNTVEPTPLKAFDENFGMEVKYFKDKVEFTQKISGKPAKGTKVTGTITYMICNDNMCLPPVDVPFEIVF